MNPSRVVACCVVALLAALLAPCPAGAERIAAVVGGRLMLFDSATPSAVATRDITGLGVKRDDPWHRLPGVDRRGLSGDRHDRIGQ